MVLVDADRPQQHSRSSNCTLKSLMVIFNTSDSITQRLFEISASIARLRKVSACFTLQRKPETMDYAKLLSLPILQASAGADESTVHNNRAI